MYRCFFALLLVLLASCSQKVHDAPLELPNIEGLSVEGLTWARHTESPTALYESQGLTLNGKLYVLGGFYNGRIQTTDKAYAFDPERKRWQRLANLPTEVTHAGQAAYGNLIYLAGGFVGDHPGPTTDEVWIYNTKKNSWRKGPPLPKKRGGGALVASAGKLHFFGGAMRVGHRYTFDSRLHWVLDVANHSTTWRAAAPLPKPRNHLAGMALNGKLYAIGGQRRGDEVGGNLRHVHAYDPQTDRWREVASLPRPLGHISASSFVHGGRLIVAGGVTNGRKRVREVLAYDPQTDRWSALTPLPEGRTSPVAGVVNGKLYVTTGTNGGPRTTTWVGRWR